MNAKSRHDRVLKLCGLFLKLRNRLPNLGAMNIVLLLTVLILRIFGSSRVCVC